MNYTYGKKGGGIRTP